MYMSYRAQFKADYEALQARMYSLPDKLTHDVMVCGVINQSHTMYTIHTVQCSSNSIHLGGFSLL